MPPVTGEPQLGGEEAEDVLNDEKGRPPDEIYERDRMGTSSRRFPSASTSKSTKISAKDSEQLGPFALSKWFKRNSDHEETFSHFPDGFQLEDEIMDEESEHAFQQQRARLVHGTWASIENVRKISSSLLVNKPQCEHIADHFKVTGDILKKLRLGKDFVSGEVLEGGSDIQTNLTFDKMHFSLIAKTFEKHLYERDPTLRTEIQEVLNIFRKLEEYIGELPAMVGSSGESLSKKPKISGGFQDYTPWRMSMKEKFLARSGYGVQHRLDEFLCFLFGVLKHGEDLVLFHSGLEGASTEVVERTGTSGEKFVQIHELLYKLLDCYACLEHCDGTEFASGYLSRPDVCEAESILYYWNSNFLQENASLVISNNFLSIEMATRIAKLLKGPNCALKKLSIESSSGVKLDQEEVRKCRLMIIAALRESVGLTNLIVRASNGKEVHELCKSLRANRVLENLVMSTDGPLADNDAMDLSAMLKENHSLKCFTLEFDDVSPEGADYLGAMLAERSVDVIYLRSKGFSRVYLKYLLGLSMACIDEVRDVILSLKDNRSFVEIRRSLFEVRELPSGESDYTQKLRIQKTRNHFFIKFTDLDLGAICEILDCLKKNKTLQVLELEYWPSYSQSLDDNREVAACLEALLVENTGLRELKVQFHAWNKCFIKHLLRPLMAKKDGEPQVNISLRQLHVVGPPHNHLDSGTISNANFSYNERDEVVKSIAQMLCINKTLSHFSMTNAYLGTSNICEIVDSLKTNKALQVLHFEHRKVFNDPQVKVAFIDLLVNYNFTLSKISWPSTVRDIEYFMKEELAFCPKMALWELGSLVCTNSDSPIVRNAHDSKQAVGTLQLEKGGRSTKEVCRSSKRAFDKHEVEVEAKDERPRLFLSYSNEMRDFAMQLGMELKSSNFNVVDQEPINPSEAMDRCQLAIVVLSDMYVNSKPSMSELCTIVKSKKTNNPTLKVYPLFYKFTLKDLQNAYVSASTIGGKGISLDIASKKALKFLIEGKIEVLEKVKDLVDNLSQGNVDVGRFCEEFSELQKSFWPSNGLTFEKNAISEEGYVYDVLEEIFHYMPTMEDCKSDQVLRHQGILEKESKLSLRQMKPVLESLQMTNFYLLRELNMAQSLQEKYIQYSSFEKMCLYLSSEQKDEYCKGRIVAALFPTTFLYHFKARIIHGPHDGNFRLMLKAIADLVAQKMQKECNQNRVQTSIFFDFVDYGAPLDPRRTIAMCQNFSSKTSDGFKQLVIVQDDLTGVYYYQCDEAANLGNPTLNESIGVIGVQVTPTEIHVDNIHEDGSSYFGVLGDFSYKFESNENKQCAAKAFGDLEGARFLSKNSGIKCSPLLIIALASAIQKKGLTLTWSNGKGHMEVYPKLALKVEVEAFGCQIQYTSNINQLGVEIEWGTSSNLASSSSAPLNQIVQRGKNEIVNQQQVLKSNVDQNVVTSISNNAGTTNVDCVSSVENQIAIYTAAAQNKSKRSGAFRIAGSGIDISYEKHDSKAKKMMRIMDNNILKRHYESEGGFKRILNLDVKHQNLENHLLRCQLHEVHDYNYLVVSNVHSTSHVSVYLAIEQNEVVPKLIWITDIFIEGGEDEIKRIFEIGLKGRELTVKRDGSNFTQLGNPSKTLATIVPRYQESLLKCISIFPSNAITSSMIQISEPTLANMLKSKNEWKHIIGPQGRYGESHKYWWNATFMQAMVYFRTMYKSGKWLETCALLPYNVIGPIGFCSIDEDPIDDKFKHLCGPMVSRGKFSRPPGSLLGNKVLWGGLEIV